MASAGVVVTGSRHPTTYGAGLAYDLGLDLATAGIAVAGGAAYGIDTAAACGALRAPGDAPGPAAVLAGGLDVAFPAGNDALLRDIAADGLLVTPYPPGTRPERARFAYRAWLLAALTPASLIVEATARGVALATARAAIALHRRLMACPGPVSSVHSDGTHRLLADGHARLVTGAADILAVVGPTRS